jgi:hypothetical protein
VPPLHNGQSSGFQVVALTLARAACLTGNRAAPPLRSINADHDAARILHAFHDLTGGAPGGDHVLHDQARLARAQGEASPQGHHAALALGEQGTYLQRPGDLVSDQNPAHRGRQHRAGSGVAKGLRQRGAQAGRVLRKLKHQRRLQIDVGVQAGRETEVTVQQRARLLVESQSLALGHAAPHSSTMARATAAGSGAAVMGRPTTR